MTYFEIHCDFPAATEPTGTCHKRFEWNEYTALASTDDIEWMLSDLDWWADLDGQRHYCRDHTVIWESDLAADGPGRAPQIPPAPPYLLLPDNAGERDVRLVRTVHADTGEEP